MTLTNNNIGNYTVISKLATGTFGTVYLAQHTIIERNVAIKLLHHTYLDSSIERGRFLQEARLLEILKHHRHILPLIDVGIHQGTPYLVTEYAANRSLVERIAGQSPHPFSIEEALNILFQIGDALHYAHLQNITHRDLKPENILFKSNGDALLADFGIAIVLEAARTKMVDTWGSPPYMAPEQFDGIVSTKSDQYALGCIAYELFTGRRPFDALTSIAYSTKHKNEKPVPPTQLNPNIPKQVENAILKALEKDRENRHCDVYTFMNALNVIKSSSAPTVQDTQEQWFDEGNSHYVAGRFNEALAAYDHAIWLDPDFAHAHNGRGLALRMLNRNREALAAYDQTIKLDPGFVKAYNNKGFVLHRLNRDREALDAYNQAIQLDPYYVLAYNNKSIALWKLNSFAEALDTCEHALQLNPEYVDAHNSKGLALEGLARQLEALAAYEKAIQLDPHFVLAYNNKGNILYYLKRYHEALDVFKYAIQLDPHFAYAYNNIGNTYYDLKQYHEALNAYERAIQLDPSVGIFHINKGKTLKHLGKPIEARHAYEKARQIGFIA